MTCKHCGSENVQAVSNVKGKIKKRGCLMTCFHIFMAICTCGLWLIIPLLRGGSHGKIKTKTEFVCLNCGKKI
jgi:DNA-directed RNA polymerase subunit RPC12/RpoP